MPRFQLKIIWHAKDQEDNDEKKTIDRCQHQDDKDVKIIWQRFLKCHDKNVSKNKYKPSRNEWKNRMPQKQKLLEKK